MEVSNPYNQTKEEKENSRYMQLYMELGKKLMENYAKKGIPDVPPRYFWRAALDKCFSTPYEVILDNKNESAYRQLAAANLKIVCYTLGEFVLDPSKFISALIFSNTVRLKYYTNSYGKYTGQKPLIPKTEIHRIERDINQYFFNQEKTVRVV